MEGELIITASIVSKGLNKLCTIALVNICFKDSVLPEAAFQTETGMVYKL